MNTFVLGVCLLVVLGGIVAALVLGTRRRWMAKGAPVEVAGGAFRGAQVTSDPRPQRRRWIVAAISLTTILWAIVTILLALGGALGALIGMDRDTVKWFWTAVGLAALDGIPLAIALITGAVLLARRTPSAVKVGAVSGIWSLAHHGLLLGASILLVFRPHERELALTTGILSFIGALQAASILASARLARLDASVVPEHEVD